MPQEEEKSRLDRELIELLNELRVLLPGVQVLFAFLLTVPFSQRFHDITALQRAMFFAAFMATAVASALLSAPGALHRLMWRQHDKDKLLQVANRLTIGGSAVLAFALSAVVFVVTDFLYSLPAALVATLVVTAVIVYFWYALALRIRGDG